MDSHSRKPANAVKEEGPGKRVPSALIEVGHHRGGVTETLDQLKRDREGEVLMNGLVKVGWKRRRTGNEW